MNIRILPLLILIILPLSGVLAQEEMTEAQSDLYTMGFGIPRSILASTDFTLETLTGDTVRLSDYKGKIVFLNFWATWCGPCRSEMPSMEKLYHTMNDRSFEMLAVASLHGDTLKTISSFVNDKKFTFPVLIDPSGETGMDYEVEGIPTTFIIGKDGNILARMVGAYDWADKDIVDILVTLADN